MSVAETRHPRRRRGAGESILMHRLLHHDRAGFWTWRVRGVQVPAARNTDVCLKIDPAAASHHCPDCRLGSVLLRDAGAGNYYRVVKCRKCRSVFMLAFVHRRHVARAAKKTDSAGKVCHDQSHSSPKPPSIP